MTSRLLAVASLLAVVAGCSNVPLGAFPPAESSLCQGLLAESVRRQVADLNLSHLQGKSVELDVEQVADGEPVLNVDYVRMLISKELYRLGAVVIEDPTEEADYLIGCLIHTGGVQMEITQFPPGWLFYLLPLSHTKDLEARVEVEFFSLETGRSSTFSVQSPSPKRTTYQHRYFLGFGPFHSSK
ncbi:MAG: hypothetical protein ACOC7S_01850 [Planctomycetota bacterium]